ncbi:MAG: hypothetical protein IJJ56_03300 [Prevotella sp.]|nr:hypothetical protein [Prevotella sp.]
MKTEQKRKYERPRMRVVELHNRTKILAGSPTRSNGNPSYNPFNDEDEW